jgi:hypothetical protein
MAIFDEPSRKALPAPTFDDVAHAARKGLLSIIPGAAVAAELLDLLSSPIAQRRDDWLIDLERRLQDLENTVGGFRFADLENNEQFVSATLQATQAALRTHQKEKLEALRNAVLNVAIGEEPDANRQQYFLALADRFSEKHFAILRFLHDPAGLFRSRSQTTPTLNHVQSKVLINTLVAQAFPDGRSKAENGSHFQLVEGILGDLVSAHLVTFERNQNTWVVPAYAIPSGGGPISKMTTHLGENFLAFITEPKP